MTPDVSPSVIVFADGACSGNPGPGGWGVIAINLAGALVTELGGPDRNTTNNQMELTAAIEALRFLRKTEGAIQLCTDSNYIVQGMTEWIHGWMARGWKKSDNKPVLNVEYWKTLHSLSEERIEKFGTGSAVQWHHVRGHNGVVGNERADEIAVAFSLGRRIELFRGPLRAYFVDWRQGL